MTKDLLDSIIPAIHSVGTPLWLYDAPIIRRQIRKLKSFDFIRYAQKACSNIHILSLMREEGVLIDSVSLGEVERALSAGYCVDGPHSPIVFTADLIDAGTLARLVELKIPVNAGSPQMLEQLGALSPGHEVWLRINPGFGHGHTRKTNTGGEHSKHGIWHTEIQSSIELIHHHGLKLVGLHMHIGSGADYEHLARVCDAMVNEVKLLGVDIEAISAGGGLSIPYTDREEEIDPEHYFQLWHSARQKIEEFLGHPVSLEIEPGRYLAAQAGILVAEVRAYKPMGQNFFVLVDAGFNDLIRPAMYGSIHRVSVMSPTGQIKSEGLRPTVIAGPLCESGDVFTQKEGGEVISYLLPEVEIGDLLIFHDCGAYGASMSSNYNTRPLLPEVLKDGDQLKVIRNRQSYADLLKLELEAGQLLHAL
ncbi:diaminopimelate decarboxylase [Pseudomonas synxantha]|uniref:Diaminopimelate decarboxylase n=1 Tax=Pseudomonas synxantha TaxID=47883 RepID=A0AAX3I5E6_9PSED|nr:diaminopimelate decarboxylase [Pseudomonas synxantha]AZE68131.1 Diaminopimelate decarboxylase [Pseudomonas synxantha]KRP50743.1 diaminopimelate decarboxylase [Pseudomonas synxantha]SDU12830.1 diaminopimelate decarboxylase [Pseudomonas synxantha]VTQ96030.1 diaminopimelate decarboxylase [Pseudomonas synxantha]